MNAQINIFRQYCSGCVFKYARTQWILQDFATNPSFAKYWKWQEYCAYILYITSDSIRNDEIWSEPTFLPKDMERKLEQPQEMLYYKIPCQWAMILNPNLQDNFIGINNPFSVGSLLKCVIQIFLFKFGVVILAHN